jgi:hypothetical protein
MKGEEAMPYLITEEDSIYVPFDADKIAEYIYRGRKVVPDEGLSADEISLHKLQISESLRKLWRGQNTQATPNRGGIPSWKNDNIPELHRAPVKRDSDFVDVVPNPTTNFLLKMVPSETPFNQLKTEPVLTNNKLLEIFKGPVSV